MNEKNKKISIVLPTYNGEKYLTESIESIINQSYENWELIIVNDCSTDNTANIAEKIAKKDNRIYVIHNKENQKLPRSLNIGFSSAKGEYWTWTSDDNLYHTDALEKMAHILDENVDVDLIYADHSLIDSGGKKTGEVKLKDPDDIEAIGRAGSCFLYRSMLAKKAGEYRTDLFLAEDYEFFIRCFKYGKCFHIRDDLYDYRQHGESLSETRKHEIGEAASKAMIIHIDFLLSRCKNKEEKKELCWSILAWTYDDKQLLRKTRKMLYSTCPEFSKYDRLLRIRNKIKRIINRTDS